MKNTLGKFAKKIKKISIILLLLVLILGSFSSFSVNIFSVTDPTDSGTTTSKKTTDPTDSGTATKPKTDPTNSGTTTKPKTGADPTDSGTATKPKTGADPTDSGTATPKVTGPIPFPVITPSENLLGKNFGCSIPEADVKIQNLVTPAAFVPVIPQNCSTFQGQPIPLSPALIPVVIGRLFGMIASLIFYFLVGVIVISGIMWMWGSIDGASSGRAKQNLKDGAVAVIVLIGSYVIIGTIVGVLGGSSIKTDLNTYFFVNTDLKTKAPAATPAAPVKPGDTTKPADPAKPDPAKPAAPAK